MDNTLINPPMSITKSNEGIMKDIKIDESLFKQVVRDEVGISFNTREEWLVVYPNGRIYTGMFQSISKAQFDEIIRVRSQLMEVEEK